MLAIFYNWRREEGSPNKHFVEPLLVNPYNENVRCMELLFLRPLLAGFIKLFDLSWPPSLDFFSMVAVDSLAINLYPVGLVSIVLLADGFKTVWLWFFRFIEWIYESSTIDTCDSFRPNDWRGCWWVMFVLLLLFVLLSCRFFYFLINFFSFNIPEKFWRRISDGWWVGSSTPSMFCWSICWMSDWSSKFGRAWC